ncbi:MAG: glycosyltransferase family 2 protein, partial [Gammaproteobacteria bacterium]|nr:glycosyltransferase family 2 protein [Gammaproteobacteria bacterium]
MLVSIVITNYDYGDYLAEAITSALNQSYQDKEIIVVDEGSSDQSSRVIASYGDSIKPIFKHHGGHCSAANAGFAISRGGILIFLDSDDYLVESAVEALAAPIRNDRSVSKCQGYLLVVDKTGRPIGRTIPRRLSPSGNYRQTTLHLGPAACRHAYTSGNAWARWFLEQVMPLPEEMNLAADGCLNPVSTLFGRTESIDKIVGAYRVHDRNKGPIGTKFSAESLRWLLDRRQRTHEHLAGWAKRLGHSVPVEVWHRYGGSWQHGLVRHALALMDGSPSAVTFGELVLSPFKTGHTSRFKALLVSALLSVLW